MLEERTRHLDWNGVLIGLIIRETMPDRHQELPRDGDQCLSSSFLRQQPFILPFPVRVTLHCVLRGCDHRRSQVLTAALGDAAGVMRLTAVVDTRTQSRVA